MKRVLLIGAVSSALLGCRTTYDTASGRPEITVARSAGEVKTAIASYLLNRGFRVIKDTDLQVVAERQTQNIGAALLFNTEFGGLPTERVTITFLSSGGNTRVVSEVAVVSNAGSAFEKVTQMTNSPIAGDMQQELAGLNQTLSAGAEPKPVAARAPLR